MPFIHDIFLPKNALATNMPINYIMHTNVLACNVGWFSQKMQMKPVVWAGQG